MKWIAVYPLQTLSITNTKPFGRRRSLDK